MGEVSTIGVDIAKSVFQIHGVDAGGTVVIRRRVGRARVLEFFADLPPCLVGMEACATAHQWARELKKLGHDTRLMPPTYVKAYVKRGKNDAADAAAIAKNPLTRGCRPHMTHSGHVAFALRLVENASAGRYC